MRPVKAQEREQYLTESRGLERDHLEEILRSRRMAWRVATGAGALLGVSLVAILLLMPLKSVEAFVLRVDDATGAVDVVTRVRDQEVSYGEVVDKYWLNLYVLNRESYDYGTIQATYDATALLSSPEVQREYLATFEGPAARDKVLANHAKIVVTVRSITPDGAGRTALVRFTTQKRSANGPEPESNLVAMIGYRYVHAPISEQDRRVNPLGFQVTSYRVDAETVGSR